MMMYWCHFENSSSLTIYFLCYFEICNLADDSVIAKASATAYNETTIDNIEVNDTSDLIIKCFKKDGYSLILKNVHINRK